MLFRYAGNGVSATKELVFVIPEISGDLVVVRPGDVEFEFGLESGHLFDDGCKEPSVLVEFVGEKERERLLRNKGELLAFGVLEREFASPGESLAVNKLDRVVLLIFDEKIVTEAPEFLFQRIRSRSL